MSCFWCCGEVTNSFRKECLHKRARAQPSLCIFLPQGIFYKLLQYQSWVGQWFVHSVASVFPFEISSQTSENWMFARTESNFPTFWISLFHDLCVYSKNTRPVYIAIGRLSDTLWHPLSPGLSHDIPWSNPLPNTSPLLTHNSHWIAHSWSQNHTHTISSNFLFFL